MRTWVVLLLFFGIQVAEGTLSPSNEAGLWRSAGVDTNYVHRFVKNELCWSSPQWREACVRGVNRGLRFIADAGEYRNHKVRFAEQLQELKPDFTAWIEILDRTVTTESKAMVWGYMVNAVLQTFDAHARIQPYGMNKTVGTGPHDGIGLGIQVEVHGAHASIRRVFKPSPAAEAGIQINDRILAIDGKNIGEGADAYVRVNNLADAAGREVRLTISREGATREVVLKMRRLNSPDVSARTVYLKRKRISIVTLQRFNAGVCEAVQAEVEKALAAKADGMILDLRFNPGGINNEATCIAQIFVANKKLSNYSYFQKSLLPAELGLNPMNFLGRTAGESDNSPAVTAYSLPLQVLVSSSSASVSEMLAAALQDLERAWIVGEPTLGKGTFQMNEPVHFSKLLQMRHSVCEVTRLNGLAIQMKGVTPNFVVPFEAADLGRVRQYPRERELFPFALSPANQDDWQEPRGDRHHLIEKCIREKNLAASFARSMQRLDGYEDYQQAVALAVFHCGR